QVKLTFPIYISPTVLEKSPDEVGGITIDKEEEIFIKRPLNKRNLGQELIKRLEELENLREKNQKLEKDDIMNQATIVNIQEEIIKKEQNKSKKTNKQLKKGLERFKRKISNLTEQNDNIKNELEKEIKEIEDELNKLRTDISTILAPEAENTSPVATDNELIN